MSAPTIRVGGPHAPILPQGPKITIGQQKAAAAAAGGGVPAASISSTPSTPINVGVSSSSVKTPIANSSFSSKNGSFASSSPNQATTLSQQSSPSRGAASGGGGGRGGISIKVGGMQIPGTGGGAGGSGAAPVGPLPSDQQPKQPLTVKIGYRDAPPIVLTKPSKTGGGGPSEQKQAADHQKDNSSRSIGASPLSTPSRGGREDEEDGKCQQLKDPGDSTVQQNDLTTPEASPILGATPPSGGGGFGSSGSAPGPLLKKSSFGHSTANNTRKTPSVSRGSDSGTVGSAGSPHVGPGGGLIGGLAGMVLNQQQNINSSPPASGFGRGGVHGAGYNGQLPTAMNLGGSFGGGSGHHHQHHHPGAGGGSFSNNSSITTPRGSEVGSEISTRSSLASSSAGGGTGKKSKAGSNASTIKEDLPMCPNDGNCQDVNDRSHQKKFRHTCRLNPCYHGVVRYHCRLFKHEPGQMVDQMGNPLIEPTGRGITPDRGSRGSSGSRGSKGEKNKKNARGTRRSRRRDRQAAAQLVGVTFPTISQECPNAERITIVSDDAQAYDIFGDWSATKVHTLKRYLHQVLGITPGHQRLRANFTETMSDDVTEVAFYGIRSGSTIAVSDMGGSLETAAAGSSKAGKGSFALGNSLSGEGGNGTTGGGGGKSSNISEASSALSGSTTTTNSTTSTANRRSGVAATAPPDSPVIGGPGGGGGGGFSRGSSFSQQPTTGVPDFEPSMGYSPSSHLGGSNNPQQWSGYGGGEMSASFGTTPPQQPQQHHHPTTYRDPYSASIHQHHLATGEEDENNNSEVMTQEDYDSPYYHYAHPPGSSYNQSTAAVANSSFSSSVNSVPIRVMSPPAGPARTTSTVQQEEAIRHRQASESVPRTEQEEMDLLFGPPKEEKQKKKKSKKGKDDNDDGKQAPGEGGECSSPTATTSKPTDTAGDVHDDVPTSRAVDHPKSSPSDPAPNKATTTTVLSLPTPLQTTPPLGSAPKPAATTRTKPALDDL